MIKKIETINKDSIRNSPPYAKSSDPPLAIYKYLARFKIGFFGKSSYILGAFFGDKFYPDMSDGFINLSDLTELYELIDD